MSTLQKNSGLVSLLVVLVLAWSGVYLVNWLVSNAPVREIIFVAIIFQTAARIGFTEGLAKVARFMEDYQTRPTTRSTKS